MTYMDETASFKCKQCDSSCTSCDRKTGICTSCREGWILNGMKCEECPSGYYSDGLKSNIDDEPVDLTLMEYSLLSFLATHPSRAYSRETLLHRVWGFEYCGGTRTVDVHIRRVRSKVGPQVASHIVTVRGVGYLFKV